jgi:tetratricopeptide (TPR) repeat protein
MLWAGRDYAKTGEQFAEAFELARTAGDDRLLAHTLNRTGNWHLNVEHPDEAIEHHQQALEIFRRLEDARGTAESLDFLTMAHALGGDVAGGVRYGREGLELYRQLEERQGLSGLLFTMAFANTSGAEMLTLANSDFDTNEFAGFWDEGMAIAREISWLPGQAFGFCNLAIGMLALGRYGEALTAARSALEIANNIGHTQWQTYATYNLACAHMDLAAPTIAESHFERAAQLANATGSLHWIRLVAADYARCLVQFGQPDRAQELLDEHQAADLPMTSVGQRGLWLARAELLEARRDFDQALAIIDQLGASAKNTSGSGVQAIAYLALVRGRILTGLGRLDEAGEDLAAALACVRRSRARPIEWQVHAASADRRLAAGRDDEARSLFALAFGIVQQLALTIEDPALRHMYLISDRVERLRREARTAAF